MNPPPTKWQASDALFVDSVGLTIDQTYVVVHWNAAAYHKHVYVTCDYEKKPDRL